MTYLWMMAIGGVSHALPEDVPLENSRGDAACGRTVQLDLLDDGEEPKCTGCVKHLAEVCGTYKGYQRHRRRKEEACAGCKAANAKRNKDQRATNPQLRAADIALTQARRRAATRLALEFPERFRELLAEERAR